MCRAAACAREGTALWAVALTLLSLRGQPQPVVSSCRQRAVLWGIYMGRSMQKAGRGADRGVRVTK
jgi:hypothetical protein